MANKTQKRLPQIYITEANLEFLDLFNRWRRSRGLPPVKLNYRLMLSAIRHSDYMRRTKRIGHVIPGHTDGATPPERAQKWGYYGRVGENIIEYALGFNPQQAFMGWLNSPSHLATMSNPDWVVMGIGDLNTNWTQMFGDRYDGSEIDLKPLRRQLRKQR